MKHALARSRTPRRRRTSLLLPAPKCLLDDDERRDRGRERCGSHAKARPVGAAHSWTPAGWSENDGKSTITATRTKQHRVSDRHDNTRAHPRTSMMHRVHTRVHSRETHGRRYVHSQSPAVQLVRSNTRVFQTKIFALRWRAAVNRAVILSNRGKWLGVAGGCWENDNADYRDYERRSRGRNREG